VVAAQVWVEPLAVIGPSLVPADANTCPCRNCWTSTSTPTVVPAGAENVPVTVATPLSTVPSGLIATAAPSANAGALGAPRASSATSATSPNRRKVLLLPPFIVLSSVLLVLVRWIEWGGSFTR